VVVVVAAVAALVVAPGVVAAPGAGAVLVAAGAGPWAARWLRDLGGTACAQAAATG